MELFYVLLVLLIVTRVLGVVMHRIGQPPLVGEILGGVILGAIISQFSDTFPVLSGLPDNEVLQGITDLSMFFLMLLAGIALKPKELASSSGKAFIIALAGFIVPLGTGVALAWAFIPSSPYKFAQTLFVGTALAITAIPVAVRVLMDLGRLDTETGRTIVSAAVFDDIFSLILLTILVALLQTGNVPSAGELLVLGLKIGVFFAVTAVFGTYVFPYFGRWLIRVRVEELELSGLVVLALGYAVLAEVLGLHFIIGAFVAGLFFSRRVADAETYRAVEGKISGLTTGFLAPIFFASIGLHLDFTAVQQAPVFLLSLIAVAFFGKFFGAGLTAYALGYRRTSATALGAAMSARGAVELIVADVALRANLFARPDPPPPQVSALFSSIVIVAVVTTFVAPIIMRFAFRAADEGERGVSD